MSTTIILAISVLLQYGAAALAWWQVRLTGHRIAWWLISTAILLMAIRRTVTLYSMSISPDPIAAHPTAEIIALMISVLMFASLLWLTPLFRAFAQSEAELRESEKKFRAIADYTYDWETWIDPNGKLIWTNPAVERFTGYTAAECLALDDYPDKLIYPDDRERLRTLFAGAVQGRHGNDVHFRVLHKDGSTSWASVSWQPIFDEHGHYLGHRASIRDISDTKIAELHAREAHERLERAQQIARLGNWTWEVGSDTCDWSEELFEIFGLPNTHGCISTTTFFQSLHPDDRPQIEQPVQEVIEGEHEFDMEYRLVRPDGEERTVHARAAIFHTEGTAPKLLGVCHDITERKHAEHDRERLIGELQSALQSAKRLRGLLPICSVCKKIRDDHGYWQQVEVYVHEHSEAEFSHSICPQCLHEKYPDIADDVERDLEKARRASNESEEL